MNVWRTKPALTVRTVVEPPVSGEALAALIRAVLEKGRAFRFRARGLSMSPFIKDGDVVTVSSPGPYRPRAGEIAAFVHPGTGKVRVHRIVGIGESGYSLKGDNALETDGVVPADHILGLVTRIERNGRAVRPGKGLAGAALARALRSGLIVRAGRRIGRMFRRKRGNA
jgi:hypothetical protein